MSSPSIDDAYAMGANGGPAVDEVDDGIRSEPVIALLDRVNAAFNGQDGGLFDGGEK